MGDEHKFLLVNWQQVCSPLQNGGLGIRNLSVFNKALLGKWLWRYAVESDSLWCQVVDSKYGSQWGGDGTRIKFWHDSWCGDQPLWVQFPELYQPLRVQFPELFRIARVPEAAVADHIPFIGSTRHWVIAFCRLVQDWEPARRESLQVRSYYSALIQPTRNSFPWRSVWKSKVQTPVAFFSWTVALGRILTIDNLRKRRVLVIDWCCMCKSDGESVNHLLLHCRIAQELWNLIFTLFETSWVMPSGVEDLFAFWTNTMGNSESGAIWKAVPHCPMWCLWRERNSRTFSGEENSVPALKYSLQTLYEWLKASNLISSYSVADMLDSCSF
uniref:Reverse transcriptase zinc-binding domain-containing protein n=1 Tax=Fagus sylvatica TaxID=28930 RepID=A0A2N9FQZ1_FAGSY